MQNNEEYNINYEYITRYIRRTMKKNEGLLAEMEEYARINEVPIAQPETAKLIENLILMSPSKKVLEIGSAIGYSSIIMANAGADVTTIERDENMFEPLFSNIEKAGHKDNIYVHQGDALEILDTLKGQYDFVFVDAAKGQYLEFLPHCMRMLKVGGIMFSDNILYKGMVATDELYKRRKVTIIRRLRNYLDTICNMDELNTVIVPIGDGAAISYRLK
ncbi:MAG: O-methyltransferase [Clostridia bacterium]|nr:O-methyltransferase [Clostridia bacterium]